MDNVLLSKNEHAELADCLMDMGALLLDCGAEINRVEDTLIRMGKAYGASHVDAFVITSLISLTLVFDPYDPVTDTRRIYSSSGTDFYRLEKLNEISRHCSDSPMPPDELKALLQHIRSGKKPDWTVFLGSILAAGSCAVFFGGTLADGFIAAAFAVVICLIQKKLSLTKTSIVASNLLLALITGLGVGIICLAVPGLDIDKIIIGDIMLLIPGLAITNAVRNILSGDTISGSVRLIESLIWAGTLAGGFMIAILFLEIIHGGPI